MASGDKTLRSISRENNVAKDTKRVFFAKATTDGKKPRVLNITTNHEEMQIQTTVVSPHQEHKQMLEKGASCTMR